MENDSYMIPCSSEPLDSLWQLPSSSPSFQGSSSILTFEVEPTNIPKVELCDDKFDHPPEKKRRLSLTQVKSLEKSFDADNKLEPDRKIQLAKDLGLQPRQVAIWFQNRRARCKTKLLEKEYDSLKSTYDKLRADYDTLAAHNNNLKKEVQFLTQKLLARTNDYTGEPKPKEEEAAAASSSKSDVEDSNSPTHYWCNDNNKGPGMVTTADSSLNSDFDEEVEDEEGFPKLEYEYLQPNSCGLGFPVQDQGTWLWQY